MPACPRCGAIIDENANFCRGCGLSLTTQDATSPRPVSENPPPPPQPQKVSVIENTLHAFTNLFIPRAPLTEVSEVAYEKLPPPRVAQSWKLIIIAVVLFAGFYVLELGEEAFPIIDGNLMYFVATYAVAFLFLLWVYRSDKYERDPFRFILALFAWGVFSGLLAGPLNTGLGWIFDAMFGNEALIAPFIEEPLKALGLYLLVRHKVWGKEFNSPLDGVVYGFAAGLGFFAMENFHYYLYYFDESIIIYRSILCWGHGVWVATVGLWLAVAKVKRGRVVIWDLFPGLLVAMTLHFLWNGWSGFLGGLGFVAMLAQGVHHLWYSQRMIKEALRDDVILGYDAGMAPVEKY